MNARACGLAILLLMGGCHNWSLSVEESHRIILERKKPPELPPPVEHEIEAP